MNTARIPRAPLLALGATSLLAGLWAGLSRIGWAWPTPASLPTVHGPLMVCGFLGTVVALERAVALRRAWGFAAPVLLGLGALALLFAPPAVAPLLIAAGSAVVVAIFIAVLRVDAGLHHVVMAAGAASWTAGNVAWALGRPIFEVVLAWLAFLVLTIVGERLELNRMLPQKRLTRSTLGLLAAALLLGVLVSAISQPLAFRIAGAAMVALSAWLFRFDIARRTVRQKGVTRFIAACLLAGYAWLAVGGALALWLGNPVAGPAYDAILHAVFVGFVFSMIFGHAPVILPSVVPVKLEYSPRFYAHAALLHLSLVARLAGDLAGDAECRRMGGLTNALAMLLFVASTVAAVRRRNATVAPGAARAVASAR